MRLKEIFSDFLENFIIFFIFLVTLTPLFFLPNNPFVMLTKQYFIIGCAFFILLFWSGWVLMNKKFNFIGKKLVYILPIIFLIGALISAIFSQYRHGSFWGSESWSNSFMTIASIVIIFLVAINYINKEKFQKFLIIFLSAIGLAQIIFLLFAAKVFKFAWLPANLIGQNISLGYISVLCLILCAGLFIFYLNKKNTLLHKSYLLLLSIVNFLVLLIINDRRLWIVLIIGAALLLMFDFIKSRKFNIQKFIFPAVILALAVIFAAVGKLDSFPQANIEFLPSAQSSLEIAKNSFFEKPFQGVGLNNYSIAYNFYRPSGINQSPFWSDTFYYSYSKFYDLWATGGLIVILPYLALLIYFSIYCIRLLISKKEDSFLGPLAIVWILYAVGNFVLISNITVDLFVWFLLAGIIIYAAKVKKARKTKPAQKYFIIIISAVLLLGAIFSLCLSVKRFVAAQAFFQARKHAFDINMQPQIEKWMVFATKWDNNNDNYYRQLANFYIVNINDLKSLSPKEGYENQYEATLQGFVQNANLYANKAVEANPSNYLNHLVLADFYISTQGLAQDALVWAEKSLNNALAVYPNNVDIMNRIATIKLNQARILMTARINLEQQNQDTEQIDAKISELLTSAREVIQRAIELKNDYVIGYYTLALIEWQGNNLEQAILIMESLQENVPNDIGVKFYLAIMYDQKGETEKAIDTLNQAIKLAPNFSDAYWTLARIYNRDGQTSLAKENLEKILEYDPQNPNVIAALENLNQPAEIEPEIISSSIPAPEQIEEIPEADKLNEEIEENQ